MRECSPYRWTLLEGSLLMAMQEIESLNIEFYATHCCECEKPLRKGTYICKPCKSSIEAYQSMLTYDQYTVVKTKKVLEHVELFTHKEPPVKSVNSTSNSKGTYQLLSDLDQGMPVNTFGKHGIMFKLPPVGSMFRLRWGDDEGLHGRILEHNGTRFIKAVVGTSRKAVHIYDPKMPQASKSWVQVRKHSLKSTTLYPRGIIQLEKELQSHEWCIEQAEEDGHPPPQLSHHWPEHREGEAKPHDPYPLYASDPVHDHNPDSFEPAPADLSPLQQIEFQDLYKLGGRVIGPHAAIVDLPKYLTAEYLSMRFKCSIAQAQELSGYWQELNLESSTVKSLCYEHKGQPIEDILAQYKMIASEMLALQAPETDAMGHINTGGYAHNAPDFGTYDREGYQAFQEENDEEDENLEELGEEEDKDFPDFVFEGYHTMDDAEDYGELWLERQPQEVQEIFGLIDVAVSLKELKDLGVEVYALTNWTQAQRNGFWAAWKVKRQAILSSVWKNVPKIRKSIAKLDAATPKECSHIGIKLHALAKENQSFYTPEGWLLLWTRYHQIKARVSCKTPSAAKIVASRRKPCVVVAIDCRDEHCQHERLNWSECLVSQADSRYDNDYQDVRV